MSIDKATEMALWDALMNDARDSDYEGYDANNWMSNLEYRGQIGEAYKAVLKSFDEEDTDTAEQTEEYVSDMVNTVAKTVWKNEKVNEDML